MNKNYFILFILIKNNRAEKLILGLGKEKENWTIKCLESKDKKETIFSDALQCATIVSYFGVLPSNYRNNAMEYIT